MRLILTAADTHAFKHCVRLPSKIRLITTSVVHWFPDVNFGSLTMNVLLNLCF
jgi:hypothetical protein